MRKLAQLPLTKLIAALAILTDDYGVWIAEEKAKAPSQNCKIYADVANEALNHCDEILLRLREGLRVCRRILWHWTHSVLPIKSWRISVCTVFML